MKYFICLFLVLISNMAYAGTVKVELDIFAANLGRVQRVESIARNTADVLGHFKCQVQKHNAHLYSSYNYVDSLLGKIANFSAGIQGEVTCEEHSYFNGCDKLKLLLVSTNAHKVSVWEDATYVFQLQCADGKQDIFVSYAYEGDKIINNQNLNAVSYFHSNKKQFELNKFDITTVKKSKLDLRVYNQNNKSYINSVEKR